MSEETEEVVEAAEEGRIGIVEGTSRGLVTRIRPRMPGREGVREALL